MVATKLHNDAPTFSELSSIANINAVGRLLNELEITYDDLLTECSNSLLYSRTVGMYIAKNSTRQGKKDEAFIIAGLSNSLRQSGYFIRTCGVNEYRPIKSGKMMSANEFKTQRLNKYVDSYKSVDGIIGGRVDGFIFAKIVIGSGGHQDNVIVEIGEYISWANQYGDPNKLYVMLIDGEVFPVLKSQQTKNIWVVNHMEFQERLLGG